MGRGTGPNATAGAPPPLGASMTMASTAASPPSVSIGERAAAAGARTAGMLSVFPAQLVFRAEEGVGVQRATLIVKNHDRRSHMVRIRKPTHKVFNMVAHGGTSLKLAPGLETAVEVSYLGGSEECDSEVCVLAEGGVRLAVPVVAEAPRTRLELQGSGAAGVVRLGKVASVSTLRVANAGSLPGTFTINLPEHSLLRVEPMDGAVPAGGSVALAVTFTPPEAGVFEESLSVEFGDDDADAAQERAGDVGMSSGIQTMTVSAQVVTQGFELLRGSLVVGEKPTGGALQLTETDFGSVYFGEATESSATVLNNGPEPVVFSVALSDGGHAPDSDDAQMAAQAAALARVDPESFIPSSAPAKSANGVLTIFPQDGVIPPYGSTTLTLTFAPTKKAPTRGFASQGREGRSEEYSFTAFVSFGGEERKLRLPVRGSGHSAALRIAPEGLVRFGDVAVHDAVDRIVTVVNTNATLPARFSVGRSATFKASPQQGDLEPGASAEVTLSYSPRTLGTHREALSVRALSATSGRTVGTSKISVTGACTAIGEKRTMVGGLRSVPADFEHSRTFVGEEGAASLQRPYARRNPWVGHATSAIFQSPAEMQLSAEEKRARDAHDQLYTTFIRRRQTARRERASGKRGNGGFDTDPVHMGMRSASGLRAPEPGMPKADDPMWQKEDAAAAADIAKATLSGAVVKPRNRPAYMDDEELHTKSKFKSRPGTLAEQRECQLMLAPQDIMRIATGPSAMNFGRVTCLSAPVQTFAVTNTLSKALMVEVCTQGIRELASSSPTAQVVPPGMTAGFDISLVCSTLGSLQRTVEYIINTKHRFAFEVSAEVVPVSVNLSADRLDFGFDADNYESFVTEHVKIANPNSHPVEFSVASSSAAYVPMPSGGMINAGKSVDLAVTWTPTSGPTAAASSEAELSLRIVGGSARRIACRGFNPEGRLAFRETSINFQSVCVGGGATRTATVRNVGSTDAVFTLDSLPPWLSCTPQRSRISPDSTTDLQITFIGRAPQLYSGTLVLAVRGSKPIKLNVAGEAIVPQMKASPEAFDFGDVYLGGTARRTLTFSNSSTIPASLELDLVDYPSFYIESPKEMWANLGYEENPVRVLRPKPDTAGAASQSGGGAPMTLERSVSTASSIGGASVSSGGAPAGGKYRIAVNPESALDVHLVFRPSIVFPFDFRLPLQLRNVADELTAELTSLTPQVRAHGLRPRLLLSTAVVDFGSRIVRSERVKKIPYTMDVEITNNDDKDLGFEFGQPVTAEGVRCSAYTLEPQSGHLARGASCVLRVAYMPHAKRDDLASVPIFLDGDTSRAYVSLELVGSGRYPKLLFDRREVTLHPVPLGFTARARFTIRNDGYDNLEIKYKLPADTARAPLEISFPNGRMIGIAKDAVEVEVSFSCRKPLGFTANVDFLDDDGGRFALPVTGATDSCLLSLYPFLSVNAGRYDLREPADGKPVALVDTSGCVFDSATIESACAAESSALARLLNASTMKGPFTKDLSRDMLASRGRLMIEVIEFLSAKSVYKVGKLSANKREQVDQLMEQHSKMLNFLKAHGALLTAVKPEFLLDLEDFRSWVDARTQRVADGIVDDGETLETLALLQQTEMRFGLVSKTSWTAVVLQTIKVFLLSRVTPRSFKSLPGTDWNAEGLPDTVLVGSNVYSVAESIMLRWLTLHFKNILPSVATTISNFDSDLRDGMALYAVMVSHWPSLESFYTQLRKPCRTDAHFQNNARVVCAMVCELALPFALQADDILKPRQHEMVLFILHLYHSLPQLIPRSALDFSGRLGEPVTKTIELTNPADKAISYSVKVDGHADFSIEQTAVRIEPRATVAFPVTCTPKISRPTEARLVFNSRRDGNVHAATLVFGLQSSVQSRCPVRTMRVSSKLYDFQSFELNVTNPFPHDGEFTVTLLQTTEPSPQQVAAAMGKRKTKAGRARAQEGALEATKQFPQPFGTTCSKVRIKNGESARLVVAYLPFTLGTHTATVLFEEASFGEFAYEVIGVSDLPTPIGAPLKLTCDVKGPYIKDIPVLPTNPALEAAKKLWVEKHPSAASKSELALVLAVGSYHSAGPVSYRATTNSPHVHAPAEMTVTPVSASRAPSSSTKGGPAAPAAAAGGRGARAGALAGTGAGGSTESASSNVLPLTLHPKMPGTYPTRVTLVSMYDVRVFDVEFAAQSSGTRAKLEFTAPARQRIVQEIPLINSGDEPLQVSATLHSSGGVFSGPRDLTVASGGHAVYPLAFRGPWIGEYTGELKLDIKGTSETNVYTLSALAEEPLAQGHIVVECAARQRASATVQVPCVTENKDVTYRVHSDLRDAVGPSTHVVRSAAGERGTAFTFEVIPQASGEEHGSLTFTGPNGMYVWYTVELRIAPPPPETEVHVEAGVRKAAEVVIGVTNPLDTPVVFDVMLEGDCLLGERELSLAPRESSTYGLVYSPLKVGKHTGSVRFVAPDVGEFWYKLHLEATADEPVIVPMLVAVVGRSTTHVLRVENPMGKPTALTASSSNARNFNVPALAGGSSLDLPPFGSLDVELVYTPSSVGKVETADVTLSAKGAGEWVFNCSGKGQPPGRMPVVKVHSSIGERASTVVPFKNPFAEPITVSAELRLTGGPLEAADSATAQDAVGGEALDDSNIFGMMLTKTSGVVVRAFETLQVPVSFTPSRMQTHEGEVLVTIEPLDTRAGVDGADRGPGGYAFARAGDAWTFPLEGVAEAPGGSVFHLRGRARQTCVEMIEVNLSGLPPTVQGEEFTHELVFPEDSGLTKHMLRIEALDERLSRDKPLRFKAIFSPQRVLSGTVDFVIGKASGGRWRFEMQLEASEPDLDGIISIEALVGHTETAYFKLASPMANPAKFTAAFTADSPLEFSVTPATGYLPAAGVHEGTGEPTSTAFAVSFTPKEYGAMAVGRLVVQTAEVEWVFEVRGARPQYVPPLRPAKVDTTLSLDLREHMRERHSLSTKRNFLKENANAARAARKRV